MGWHCVHYTTLPLIWAQSVISIDDNMKLLVSSGVNGNQMVEQLFWQFSNKVIDLPKNTKEHPKDTFIHWHREQVFKL